MILLVVKNSINNEGVFVKKIVFYLILSLFQFSSAHASVEDGITAYTKQEYAIAYVEFLPYAEEGDPVAQYHLGMIYLKGLGIEQKPKVAIKWLIKSAEQGYAEAQFELGNAYRKYSKGNDQTYEAARWNQKAAEQGHVGAQLLHAKFLLWKGTDEYHREGASLYMKLAEQGIVGAQEKLGYLYGKGKGVSKDETKALYWVRKAAEQGSTWAMAKVGVHYY